ncbi:DUF4215 domain-containing protein [Patescibacteria group bacterium]|nr:MAG: DUF4215 domain-containing protein [Patescibacteria group bacterium]
MRLKPAVIGILAAAALMGAHVAFAQGVDASFAERAGFSTEGDLVLIIARLIRTVLGFLGVIVVVLVLYGGFLYMTAAGEQARVDKAKKVLTNAVIGLVIVLSSFAIAQFVVGSLSSATGTTAGFGPGGGGSPGGFFGDGGAQGKFVLSSANVECAEALRNFRPQLVFSQAVDAATAQAGIIVRVVGGSPVDGSLAVSGKKVTFIPDAACDAAPQERCFPGDVDIEIVLSQAVLKSAAGRALSCDEPNFPCTIPVMRTGTGVDTRGPTAIIQRPGVSGTPFFVPQIELLQALTRDDTGVSSVEFSVDQRPVFIAGIPQSVAQALVGGNADNAFNTDDTEWATSGSATNKMHTVSAEASDCAGHTVQTPGVGVMLRAANCQNGVTDAGFGETAVDCGGDSSSANFCGACLGASCASGAECASGMCTSGACVSVARIDRVSPGDGAVGNLITITGAGFGATPGTVEFLAGETGSDQRLVTDFACAGASGWSDRQIVVRVPDGAGTGPILIRTADQLSDRTDDAFGPFIADFEVNDVVRPGLCSLTPESGARGTQVTLSGINLGTNPDQTNSVFFGNTEASRYRSWADTSVRIDSPALDARTYGVQAFVGDNVCANDAGKLCRVDADCASSTCTIRRQGSNPVNFAATSGTAGAPPVITLIDTGWTACTADDKRCATDADCGGAAGSCASASNFGPPGQYVTLFGSRLGTSTGTVTFQSVASGTSADADITFPAACGDQFWHDGSVTVKVPQAVKVGTDAQFGAYKVSVRRAEDGVVSEAVDFNLLDPASNPPGPSLCALDPESGPPTTLVSFIGENFGDAALPGNVFFTQSPSAATNPASWADGLVSAAVPAAGKTGPSLVRSAAGFRSNAVPFQVADCRDDAAVCKEGNQCCADGACRAQCAPAIQNAFYGYRFSTGPIPKAPHLVFQCNPDDPLKMPPSPSPWAGRNLPANVCLDAMVSGTFDMDMNAASLQNAGNVVVEKCTGPAGDPCGSVEGTPMAGTVLPPGPRTFLWSHPAPFEADTFYRVTLRGGVGAGVITSAAPANVPLATNETWRFRTAPAGTVCTIGDISVAPPSFTATAQDQEVAYQSLPLSQTDRCIILSCDGGAGAPRVFDWSLSSSRAVLVAPKGQATVTNSCLNTVTAKVETNAGEPVVVSAALRAPGTPTGSGDLTINFTDPKVVDFAPDCDLACVNAAITATFNTRMDKASVEAPGAVKVVECANELCEDANPVPFTAFSVEYVDSADGSVPPTVTLFHSLDAQGKPIPFKQNQNYRVSFDGDSITGMRSASGVPLHPSGTNRGKTFSWTFKTKDSAVTCSIDRVEVSPKRATAQVIGERREFRAKPFGAPDACSKNGQLLDPADYDWLNWTSRDVEDTVQAPATVVAASLVANGAISLAAGPPKGCTSSCLSAGTPFTTASAVCGDGRVGAGEDCDGGSGCSASCLHAGTDPLTPATPAGLCGNGQMDVGEDCDDGNVASGDGCSSRCLNEGAAAVQTNCGEVGGTVDYASSRGGEECEDGNRVGGDGCSSNCLNEGSTPRAAVAVCGNGLIERPTETCDDGNAVPGDGCSGRCVREGRRPGAGACGNALVERAGASDAGEDCDDGNVTDGDGCSSECLFEGSSVGYATPSFCADGTVGAGEVSECEAGLATRVGPYAVAVAANTAPREIDAPEAHEAVSRLRATGGNPAKSGEGDFAVQCACENDAACGDVNANGCGAGSCCFERPRVTSTIPASGAPDVCRNTLVQVEFSQKMDPKSFDRSTDAAKDPQLYLELVSLDGTPVTAATCPHGSLASAGHGFFGRFWGGLQAFFGRSVSAQAAGTRCLVPIKYDVTDGALGASRVSLAIQEALKERGTYRLVAAGDAGLADATSAGVLSADGVGMAAGTSVTFTTGFDICALDEVLAADLGQVDSLAANSVVPPSRNLFTKKDETHRLNAVAVSNRGGASQPIQPIPGSYAWSWSFGSNKPDAEEGNVITVTPAPTPAPTQGEVNTDAKAVGIDGVESAAMTATITVDKLLDPPTDGTDGRPARAQTGFVELTVLVCENPWPSLTDGFPYVEDEDTNPDPQIDTSTNYSFYYCRDAGRAGAADDLAELEVKPIARSPIAGVIKEILYPLSGAAAGVGVRVVANPGYLPADLFFQGLVPGGKAVPVTLDGYEAVRDGNTIYATAANQVGDIFPNVYIFSVSQGAPSEAAQVLDQVAKHWAFNANDAAVSDVNLCRAASGNYVVKEGSFVSCEWDGDCDTAAADAQFCDAEKAKLRRDTRRLTDLVRVKASLDRYGATHAHCSATRAQGCDTRFPSCPSGELCLAGVPTLSQGSFIRTLTTSAWPSWTAVLGNELGGALPVDPLNEFFECEEGADPATCFNASSGEFLCKEGSHVYGFQSSAGETYTFTALLEHAEAPWAFDIDKDPNDNAFIRVEYPPAP